MILIYLQFFNIDLWVISNHFSIPGNFKFADMAPNHKNNSCLKSSNYRHVSIFFNLSKIFERFLHRMIFKYFETIGSSNQWGFWNGCKAQIVILAVLEKCKSVLAESGKFGTLSNWLQRYCNWFYCAWFKNSQTSRMCFSYRNRWTQ